MYKLWLKVNELGVITHTLFGNYKGEPLGFDSNFVVEDSAMMAELRNSTQDWYVKDNKLCRKELIKINVETIKPEDSEDDIVRANGIDKYRITVQDCSASEVNVWLSKEKVVLPTDDELILTSNVATMFCLEVKGIEYKTLKPIYLRFE
jgi:hypothetical protein